MNIGFFVGEITSAPAEVICTSTNPHLNLMSGSAGVVRQAGGDALKTACDQLIEREAARSGQQLLPSGSAPATVPGELPFQAVIHCIAFDTYLGTKPEIIADCVRNAIQTGISLRPRPTTVAMPVFAADNGRHDFATALRTMADALHAASAQPLENVWIVWKDAAEQAQAEHILGHRFGAIEVRTAAG